MSPPGLAESTSRGEAVPIRAVLLEGDAAQRGAALRALATRDEARAAMPFYTGFLGRSIRAHRPRTPRLLLDLIDGLSSLLLERIARRQDGEIRAALAALAAGETRAFGREIRRVHAVMDLLQLLVGRVPGIGRLAATPPSACSTFIALGEATLDGRLLHGRNFDLPASDVVSTAPLVTVHRPAHGLAHVSLFHRPAFVPGVTTINERGLGISIHTHFTRDAGWSGTPILSIARALAETAGGVSEAIDLLRRLPPICGWSFYLSDPTARRAAAVERGRTGMAVREAERGMLWGVNRFLDETLARREVIPSSAFANHNEGRRRRLAALAGAGHGRIDAPRLAAILGDGHDPAAGAAHGLGGAICAPYNVLSVIYAFEADRLYVGRGGVPASTGPYDGLVLSRLLERGEIEVAETLMPALDDAACAARRALARAAAIWSARADRTTALSALDEAVARTPGDGSLRIARAATRLPVDPEGAARDVAEAARLPAGPFEDAQRNLIGGFAADLLGRRDDALAAYRLAEAGVVPEVTRAARRALRRPVRCRQVARIGPDLYYGGLSL